MKNSGAGQLFFSQTFPKTVLKIDFWVLNYDLSQTASKGLSLPGHSADHEVSEYVYKSLGEFGDKYEISLFLFWKFIFFSLIAIFRRKGCEKLWKSVNKIQNKNMKLE